MFQDFTVIHDYLVTPSRKMQARLRKRGQDGNTLFITLTDNFLPKWTATYTLKTYCWFVNACFHVHVLMVVCCYFRRVDVYSYHPAARDQQTECGAAHGHQCQGLHGERLSLSLTGSIMGIIVYKIEIVYIVIQWSFTWHSPLIKNQVIRNFPLLGTYFHSPICSKELVHSMFIRNSSY